MNSVKEDYGKLEDKNRKIILEHTSANPNGPLHIGHIRNSIIGDSLARVLKSAGYDVETQYYVNDMGRQIAMIVWGNFKTMFIRWIPMESQIMKLENYTSKLMKNFEQILISKLR